jgi:hypothetical protein
VRSVPEFLNCRIHPPGPGTINRVMPPGGIILNGHHVPEGVLAIIVRSNSRRLPDVRCM